MVIPEDCAATTGGNLQTRGFSGELIGKNCTTETFLCNAHCSHPFRALGAIPELLLALSAPPELPGFGNSQIPELTFDSAPGHEALEGKLNSNHLLVEILNISR